MSTQLHPPPPQSHLNVQWYVPWTVNQSLDSLWYDDEREKSCDLMTNEREVVIWWQTRKKLWSDHERERSCDLMTNERKIVIWWRTREKLWSDDERKIRSCDLELWSDDEREESCDLMTNEKEEVVIWSCDLMTNEKEVVIWWRTRRKDLWFDDLCFALLSPSLDVG